MPKLSKGHNSGNVVYKVAFPIAIFTRGKFYYGEKMCYFPGVGGGGGDFTTRKYHSHLAENRSRFFRGKILVADNHSRFFFPGERAYLSEPSFQILDVCTGKILVGKQGMSWYYVQLKHLNHDRTKRVFGSFRPGQTQTGLHSHRS